MVRPPVPKHILVLQLIRLNSWDPRVRAKIAWNTFIGAKWRNDFKAPVAVRGASKPPKRELRPAGGTHWTVSEWWRRGPIVPKMGGFITKTGTIFISPYLFR